MTRYRLIIAGLGAALLAGCGAGQAVKDVDSSRPLATVNGEVLDEGDFERSQSWLPSFARQLESNNTIEVSRYWSLIQMMLMAQDARDKGVLSDAERSLAIKEALAKRNIDRLAYPNYVIGQAEIDAWLEAHPDAVREPAQFVVNYALVKNERTIPVLVAAFAMAGGAQLGYNFVDPPALDRKGMAPGPLMRNTSGHPMDAKKFDYVFAVTVRENEEEQAVMGPFSERDGLLFSCPEAIRALETAPLYRPIGHSIACSGDWKAFVIPEWRRDAGDMAPDKARQVAVESLTEQKRAVFREEYVREKLARQHQ